MNLIERAGRQLGLKPAKPLVERAADRLSAVPAGGGAATTAAPTPFPSGDELTRHSSKAPQRVTRRRIAIDFDRLRGMGFSLPGDQSALAEEFRLVKRPLLEAIFAPTSGVPVKNANVVMVTSAHPHEGKTFVAANLAFSMASEHDLHVLLIDADFPDPAITTLFGFEARTGLMDLVADSSADFADVLIRTNIENLSLLASGEARPRSSELLASGRMARFVEQISKRYPDRITIFDAPPVLARSEPIMLAKHVGQVVVVMEAERTSRVAVEEVIGLLGADRVSLVLNKAAPIARDQFGRYYGSNGR